jgi:hypothetical protein
MGDSVSKRTLVSKAEQKEVRLEVGLPAVGFPKTMYFNRFHIEREEGFSLVQFGLVSASGLLDSFSCVFPADMLQQNEQTLLDYLNRIGRPAESAPPSWKGAAVDKGTQVADVVTMAFRGGMAETCLFFFSLSAATRQRRPGVANETVPAQPLVLLRSTADVQKQLIVGLYEE